MRIARIATIEGRQPDPQGRVHVIPLNSGHTLCGETVMTTATDRSADRPTCQWCQESLRDLVVALVDPATIDRNELVYRGRTPTVTRSQ